MGAGWKRRIRRHSDNTIVHRRCDDVFVAADGSKIPLILDFAVVLRMQILALAWLAEGQRVKAQHLFHVVGAFRRPFGVVGVRRRWRFVVQRFFLERIFVPFNGVAISADRAEVDAVCGVDCHAWSGHGPDHWRFALVSRFFADEHDGIV